MDGWELALRPDFGLDIFQEVMILIGEFQQEVVVLVFWSLVDLVMVMRREGCGYGLMEHLVPNLYRICINQMVGELSKLNKP